MYNRISRFKNDEQNKAVFCVKYKEKKNMKETLNWLKDKEEVLEIYIIEMNGLNIMEGVNANYCLKNKKTTKITRVRKPPQNSSSSLRKGLELHKG